MFIFIVNIMTYFLLLQQNDPSTSLIINEQNVEIGQVFSVNVIADTQLRRIDTVDFYIDFDSNYLEVVDKNGNTPNGVELNSNIFSLLTYNSVDNINGKINVSASQLFSPYLSGILDVAIIRFKVKHTAKNTELKLIRNEARWSDMYLGGDSIMPVLNNAYIYIDKNNTYLPIINN